MNTKETMEFTKAKRLAEVYNMVPNLLWSVLGLGPIAVFWYTYINITLLLVFVGISIFPVFLSPSFIDRMQVAKRTTFHKKLKLDLVQRLSQNGEIVNKWIRKKYPTYKVFRRDQKMIKSLSRQTYVFEKFHLMLFVFFLLTCLYAFSKGLFVWAAIIFILNVVYNVYPILLQQLIRQKLTLLIRKNNTEPPAAKQKISNFSLKCMS